MPPWTQTIHGQCKMTDPARTDETTHDCPKMSPVLEEWAKRVERLQTVTVIAKSPGNADWDPYLHGMANGLLLALHIMTCDEDYEGDPPWVDAPEVWGHEDQSEPMGEFHGSLHTVVPPSPDDECP